MRSKRMLAERLRVSKATKNNGKGPLGVLGVEVVSIIVLFSFFPVFFILGSGVLPYALHFALLSSLHSYVYMHSCRVVGNGTCLLASCALDGKEGVRRGGM